MSVYTDFYDYVLYDVPGAPPQNLLTHVIRNTVIDFCESTRLYKFDHANISVVANTHTYTITPEAGTVLSDVLFASFDNKELQPKSVTWLDDFYGTEDWRNTKTGTPVFYFLSIDKTGIRLVPTPDGTGTLRVTISQKPSRVSTTIPNWILEEYVDVISHGARYRIFSMRQKPWTSPELAEFHRTQYFAGVGHSNMDADRNHTRSRHRTKAYWR